MKVLIAIDDSAYSDAAINYVMDQCWPKNTEFRIVNIVEPMYMAYAGGYMGGTVPYEDELAKQNSKMIHKYIEKLKKCIGDPTAQVDGQVQIGPVALCILELAKSWEADLIVVGSHGRKGFQKFFLGSVAEKIARHATCSVEVVKIKQQIEAA